MQADGGERRALRVDAAAAGARLDRWLASRLPRLSRARLQALVRGDNGDHTVTLADGLLGCDCDHYQHERLCAHVLTVERVLKLYIPANSAPFPGS